MTVGLAGVVMTLLAIVVAATVVHALVVLVVIAMRRRAAAQRTDLPPVTWYRPLKAEVSDLHGKLAVMFASAMPGDQVLLGVDPDTASCRVTHEFARRFGDNAQVVECRPGAAKNPKISKLIQMAPFARHSRWIVADSEALIDPAFAVAFRTEWQNAASDVMTAGYRFTGTEDWVQRLDAMSTVLTLWPGLELVRTFGTVRFTLGACTAVHRADVDALGGWTAFGDELAEDYWLGARLCERGKSVRLSDSIITLDADAMNRREYWRHQLRVAATYRGARPLGTAGMILTRGVTAGMLASIIDPLPGLLLFCVALVTRVALAEAMAARRGFPLKNPLGLVIVSDAVEVAAWLRAWFSRTVWWGGRPRRITWRGRLRD